MRPGQFTSLVLKPSLFSGSVSAISSIILLSAANWPALMGQPRIHNYFLGPDGLVTLLRSSHGSTAAFAGLFNGSLIDNVIILLVALAVGLVILVILEGVRRFRADAARLTTRETRLRMGARLLTAVVWILYIELTVKVILPFSILASDVGVHALWRVSGFGYLIFGAMLLAASLHVHTVLLRLFLLRVRVFGGEEALFEAESRF